MTGTTLAIRSPFRRQCPADDRSWRGFGRLAAALPVLALLWLSTPALADLRLCNRMSYVIDVAIAIEEGSNAATQIGRAHV